MAAITAAEEGLSSVLVLEASSKPLEKVRISGGGRCNVTNACWNPIDLVANYPRGGKPLLGPFSRFAVGDAVSWFANHGVNLLEEEDGRMFPASNSSDEIVSCLRNSAKGLGITIRTSIFVQKVNHINGQGFLLYCRNGKTLSASRILLATGSHPSGRHIAVGLGHSVEATVPSLFSLTLNDTWLTSCPGLSFEKVRLSLNVGEESFNEEGKMLITHWGLSGPVILKLSAFAARSLHTNKYRGLLSIDWLGSDIEDVKEVLIKSRYQNARRTLFACSPFPQIPKRLWRSILTYLDIPADVKWAHLSSISEKRLLKLLAHNFFKIVGRGPFGEEFVSAGGVKIEEVNLKRMESQLCKKLYFAGEVLNIDGITGGFNFQHCWTSGWLAGKAIAQDYFVSRQGQ